MENTNLNNESKAVDSTENKENTTKKEVATETKEKVKSFTQEDIDKIIARTIARERKKADEEKTEAEKLAKMSAEEKAKHEFDKEKAKFEAERKSYMQEKLSLQVQKELVNKKLPAEFSKFLTGTDAETSNANIQEFEKLFGDALEKLVTERLKGKTPPSGNRSNGITKEQFKKMSIEERQKLYCDDRALFEQLSK